jgi:shikimate kinase
MMERKYGSRNIFLVGLMGAGKTTVGRMLAKRLNLAFGDSDREIENRTGVVVPTIFEIEGEEGFRRRETKVIADMTARRDSVLATGGGAVLRQENRDNLKANGFVIYLNAPPHVLWERTRHDKNRPLLRVDDPLRKLQELFFVRDPIYREVADLVVDDGKGNAQAIVQMLAKEVSDRWSQ